MSSRLNWKERLSSCVAVSVRQRVAAIAVIRAGEIKQIIRRDFTRTRDRALRTRKLGRLLFDLVYESERVPLIVEPDGLAEAAARWSGLRPLPFELADAKAVLLTARTTTHGELYHHLVRRVPDLRRQVRLLSGERVAHSATERRRTVTLNAVALGLGYAELGSH